MESGKWNVAIEKNDEVWFLQLNFLSIILSTLNKKDMMKPAHLSYMNSWPCTLVAGTFRLPSDYVCTPIRLPQVIYTMIPTNSEFFFVEIFHSIHLLTRNDF